MVSKPQLLRLRVAIIALGMLAPHPAHAHSGYGGILLALVIGVVALPVAIIIATVASVIIAKRLEIEGGWKWVSEGWTSNLYRLLPPYLRIWVACFGVAVTVLTLIGLFVSAALMG